MKRLSKNRKGFSLLELLAVVTILGVIAAVIISRFSDTSYTAKKKLNAHNKAVVNATVERYYLDKSAWPSADLTELNNNSYFPDGIPVSPWDGTTKYKISTTTHRVNNVSDPAAP